MDKFFRRFDTPVKIHLRIRRHAESNETAKLSSPSLRASRARANHNSLSPGESFLESFILLKKFFLKFEEIATAPTATGPASGPLPASSIPTICGIFTL